MQGESGAAVATQRARVWRSADHAERAVLAVLESRVDQAAADPGALQVSAHCHERQKPQRSAAKCQADADDLTVALGHDAAFRIGLGKVTDPQLRHVDPGLIALLHGQPELVVHLIDRTRGHLLHRGDIVIAQQANVDLGFGHASWPHPFVP